MVIDWTEKLYMIAISNLVQWGVSVDIPGLSMDGHSYSGTQGYSWGYTDMAGRGGVSVDISGLSVDGHSYSGI